MRLHGFGHGAPQGRVHFGTFKRVWQLGVLYSLWENRMLQTARVWMCSKIDPRSLIGGDLCSKLIDWVRKVTSTLRASHKTVVLNIKSTLSTLLSSEVVQSIFWYALRVAFLRDHFSIHPVEVGKEPPPRDESFIRWLTSLWASNSNGILTCQSWFVSNVARVPGLELSVMREVSKKREGDLHTRDGSWQFRISSIYHQHIIVLYPNNVGGKESVLLRLMTLQKSLSLCMPLSQTGNDNQKKTNTIP